MNERLFEVRTAPCLCEGGIPMTITYILQVLHGIEEGRTDEALAIADMNGELQKALRRVKRSVIRLRNRAQYELGEMDRAKAASTSGHMEHFAKAWIKIQHFNLDDCKGLKGIEDFLNDGFKVEEMIAQADKIASLSAIGAFTPMELGFGILEPFATLPSLSIDNHRFHQLDPVYIHQLIEDITAYQAQVRELTENLAEVAEYARDKADCLTALTDYFVDGIEDLEAILDRKGIDWTFYSKPERMQIARALQVAQLIALLFPQLLDEKGHVSERSKRRIAIAKKELSFRDA